MCQSLSLLSRLKAGLNASRVEAPDFGIRRNVVTFIRLSLFNLGIVTRLRYTLVRA